jgi:hypothetical protein
MGRSRPSLQYRPRFLRATLLAPLPKLLCIVKGQHNFRAQRAMPKDQMGPLVFVPVRPNSAAIIQVVFLARKAQRLGHIIF